MSAHSAAHPPLTRQAEDYLKAIYEIERNGEPAGTTAIAARLGIASASASGMIRRLARLGLVTAERYQGARLTARGRRVALQMIRRHRVLESYLVTRLGFGWDGVHDEAERLEHAASPALIQAMADALGNPEVDPHGAPIPRPDGTVDDERAMRIDLEHAASPALIQAMADALGNPEVDPHGAPIPRPDGTVDDERLRSVDDLAVGESARVARMSDRDPALLRYLGELGIRPGASLRLVDRGPFDGPLTVAVGRVRHVIGLAVARRVYVR